jgi:hypothetical protein
MWNPALRSRSGKFARMVAVIGTCAMVLLAQGIGSADARAASDSPSLAATAASREYLLKAAFLYNFAKFTTWPAEVFLGPQTPLRVCILGKDSFGAAMDSIEGKNIKERLVAVARITQVSDADRCQILFVSTSEEERLRAILDYLHDRPILTIAEMPNFAMAGGIISLKTVEDRIQFEINVDAANAVDLRLSSKLLRLGDIISTGVM